MHIPSNALLVFQVITILAMLGLAFTLMGIFIYEGTKDLLNDLRDLQDWLRIRRHRAKASREIAQVVRQAKREMDRIARGGG